MKGKRSFPTVKLIWLGLCILKRGKPSLEFGCVCVFFSVFQEWWWVSMTHLKGWSVNLLVAGSSRDPGRGCSWSWGGLRGVDWRRTAWGFSSNGILILLPIWPCYSVPADCQPCEFPCVWLVMISILQFLGVPLLSVQIEVMNGSWYL